MAKAEAAPAANGPMRAGAETSVASMMRLALTERLASYRKDADRYPGLNPIARLAYEIATDPNGENLGEDGLHALVQHLTVRAFEFRAARLSRYLGNTRRPEVLARLYNAIEALADRSGSFAVFRDCVEQTLIGIVITAHPTFGISSALAHDLARLAEADLTDVERATLLGRVEGARHGNPDGVTLSEEQERATAALVEIGAALRTVHGVVLSVARTRWAQEWITLIPALVGVASWVGYDLDGRADILWTDTFRARLSVKQRKIDGLIASVRGIIAAVDERNCGAPALLPNLQLLETRLQFAARILRDDRAALPNDPSNEADVARFARHMAAGAGERLTDTQELLTLLDQALDHADDPKDLHAIAVLRAEIAHDGLSIAGTHVRLNASQIRNAIRKQIGMDSAPDEPGLRHRYLKEVTDLLGGVTPTTVNFGSILSEPTSARRMCMLIAQMLKYIDRSQPVRFLIAETETPFTVLAALYLARLFSIDRHVDISPLFETADALEHGHGIVADLLSNPHYRDYVVARGCLCIQTGFSDSGRYVGQVAASLAIERLKMKVAHAMAAAAEEDPRVAAVTLVVFDTHGESVGRGAHPVDFRHRLDHVSPPMCRRTLRRLGLQVREEVSFQGGDGYLFFQTAELALATVGRLVEHALEPLDGTGDADGGTDAADPFYVDTDYSLEFFLAAKTFNEALFEDTDYAALLNAFGVNLLYPSGSRQSKRQHEGPGGEAPHPSQIRAIPNNAILQQMGFLSNSASGLGRAIAIDPDRFVAMHSRSQRCRGLISLAHYAAALGSADALLAYVGLFDPLAWIQRARNEANPIRREDMRRLGRLLTETGRHERLARVARALLADRLDLEAGLSLLDPHQGPRAEELAAMRMDIDLLHAIRIALIQRIFLLVMRVPRFSSQPDVTIDDVVADLLQLDVPRGVAVLMRAYPLASDPPDETLFGEPATYRVDDAQGYGEEHEHIFRPLIRHHDLVRRISAALSHVAGAVG